MTVPDEVDPHQLWPVGHTGGGEQLVHRPVQLVDSAVDRILVAEVQRDHPIDIEVHRREVHHGHMRSERLGELCRCGAHPGRAADHQDALALVAQ